MTNESEPETFIRNYNCSVVLEAPGVLHCSTSGRLVTMVLFGIGMLLLYGSIVVIAWDLPQGRMHSSSLIYGSLIFLAGIFFQWRCMRRKKEMGDYNIDSNLRLIAKPGIDAGISFDYITQLRLAKDWTAIQPLNQLPYVPYWLFIHFKNGRRIRIATGRRDEIMRLLRWLRDAGMPAVEWV